MKHIKTYGVLLLLLSVLLSGCSTETLMEHGANFLDRIFAGDPAEPKPSTESEPPSSPAPETDPAPSAQEPEQYPEAVEPSIPDPEPAVQEPSAGEPAAPSGNITSSHTDITFFGPGESFKYLPVGAEGVYACTYASEDETIASVDPDTGKVTAVGPGTTNVTMHVECGGQYDFACIVRCNWEEPSLPAGSSEPVLPPESEGPAESSEPGTDTITASHSDATFFNPKEHFRFLPVGARDDVTCSYTTGDANIASVDEKGVVTAVGPGTTTVTMTVEGGGTEYIFKCIVRCHWD